MQQVKKQLQDAIAELKSEWGINEVKREDLAAVLEKVVAALDRAAQLPVAEPQTSDFDKYFCRTAVGMEEDYEGGIQDGNCDNDSYPAVYIYQTRPCRAYTGFIGKYDKMFYRTDYFGRSFEDVVNGRILYNRNSLFTLTEAGTLIGTNGEEINDGNFIREYIRNAGWEI